MFYNQRVEFLYKWLFLFMPVVSIAFGALIYLFWCVLGTDNLIVGILPALILYIYGSLICMGHALMSIPPIEEDKPRAAQVPDIGQRDKEVRIWAYTTEYQATVDSFPVGEYRIGVMFKELYNNNEWGVPFTSRQFEYLFSPLEFSKLRDAMIKAGYAAWKTKGDHRGGVEITAFGRRVIRCYIVALAADQEANPSPELFRRFF